VAQPRPNKARQCGEEPRRLAAGTERVTLMCTWQARMTRWYRQVGRWVERPGAHHRAKQGDKEAEHSTVHGAKQLGPNLAWRTANWPTEWPARKRPQHER
jgi:hypothetical protein